MKKYTTPEAELMSMLCSDIITSSGTPDDPAPATRNDPGYDDPF